MKLLIQKVFLTLALVAACSAAKINLLDANGYVEESGVADYRQLKKKKNDCVIITSDCLFKQFLQTNQWCLDGGEGNNCNCPNPLIPLPPRDDSHFKVHQENVQMANQVSKKKDVTFLGDSIIYFWLGTKPGHEDSLAVFNKFFNKEMGAKFDGLALGISGDESPHLLWRLQHGEMPSNLQSKVYWVLVGTNDFAQGCSIDIVFIGIIQIVEELRDLRPNSIIVLNGILPRTDKQGNGDFSTHKIWDAIQIVNERLRKYSKKQRNVLYFDAHDLFLRRDSEGHEYIPMELLFDFLHPTAAAYEALGTRIVKKLSEI